MTSATITAELVRRGLAVKFSALPDDLVTLATLCLLDYAGVALAGLTDPSARILREQAIDDGHGPCSLIGHPARLSASQAALANGTAGHALDYDDVHMSLPGHVSVAILPAILALAEARCLSPNDVIASFVAGYETGCRIGILVAPDHYARGFHATATVGSFASALACAHLLRLNEQRTVYALGIAGAQAAGLKAQFGTMCKPLHAGKAAQNGVLAALLAERGMDSAPDILGGSQAFAKAMSSDFNSDAALETAPNEFHLRDNLFKFHASCYGTHGIIEAVRKLRGGGVNDIARLASVTARVGAVNDRMCNIQTPRTSAEAKFSLRLMAAYAFNDIDTARLDAFGDSNMVDPRIDLVRDKIRIVPEQELTMTQAFVTAQLDDGTKLNADHDASLPERDLEMLKVRLRQKFMGLAAPALGEMPAAAIAESIERFVALPRVDAVTNLLATS
jgi:2-methylcitrate dehydratase PrpD